MNPASLHLPALSIRGFRGIDHLAIPRLGRVTLLAGRNGIGKTTVLDAVRVYAARGRPSALVELLEDRDELSSAMDEDNDRFESPDIGALFHGRDPSSTTISISPNGRHDALQLEVVKPEEWPQELKRELDAFDAASPSQALKLRFKDQSCVVPLNQPRWRPRFDGIKLPASITCNSLGPGVKGNDDLAELWDNVALTDDEGLYMEAFRLMLGDQVSRVAVIGSRRRDRRIAIRLANGQRVPLKSLGDGANRLFAVALALANSRGGFMVIDEAENGIHYAIQKEFWRLLIKAAIKYDVQVLATTHSKDCIDGFGLAARTFEDVEGILIRIERKGDGVRAVEYSEEELEIAAYQGIETR